jgi:hypothetical protein
MNGKVVATLGAVAGASIVAAQQVYKLAEGFKGTI